MSGLTVELHTAAGMEWADEAKDSRPQTIDNLVAELREAWAEGRFDGDFPVIYVVQHANGGDCECTETSLDEEGCDVKATHKVSE